MKPKLDKPVILFCFGAQCGVRNEKFGEQFFGFLKDKFPELFPEFVNFYEPINKIVLPSDDLSILGQYWVKNGLWRRKSKFKSMGHILPAAPRYEDGMFKLYISKMYDKNFLDVAFFKAAAEAFNSECAVFLVDTVHARELDEANSYNHSQQVAGALVRTFSEPMPNLGWAQFMSNYFLDCFFSQDAERISALTAAQLGFFKVERSNEGVYWQLTESPMDVESDFQTFQAIRNKAKGIIGSKYFEDIEGAWKTANQRLGKISVPSITVVAIDDVTERAEAIAAMQRSTQTMPEWERILREFIADPVQLDNAIQLTRIELSKPLPDIDMFPQEHEAETKRRASLLRAQIFPEEVDLPKKRWSLGSLFGGTKKQ